MTAEQESPGILSHYERVKQQAERTVAEYERRWSGSEPSMETIFAMAFLKYARPEAAMTRDAERYRKLRAHYEAKGLSKGDELDTFLDERGPQQESP